MLPGGAWSSHRHARDKVLQVAPGYHGLRKTIVILSWAFDLLRSVTPEQAQAFLSQVYKAAQSGSKPRRATRTSSGRTDDCSWGRRLGWCAAPGLHAVGTRSARGLPSRPGALGQTPVRVEVERKRLRAKRRRRMPLEETPEPKAMPTCGLNKV